ncbi:MAG TPA: carboxypeptidase-like regulatory domain-containing protein [Blastocatellia bacterium]|nr:carboxypeptidase-like regulatory domain-containing protein [Blastocatellia bacterium]
MKYAVKLGALVAIGLIACVSAHESYAAAAMGSIRGVVKDGNGNPLMGAAVLVLGESEEAKTERVVKRANTDKEGKFIAAGILPGRYRVKAEAEGFKPIIFAADVRPNKVTVFDSILLRKVGTLAEYTSLHPDPKHTARRARGTIFQHSEGESEAAEAEKDTSIALTDRASDIHGYVNAFGQTAPGLGDEDGSFFGANFAVSQQIGRDANFVISGQAGFGGGAPQRLEALTTAYAGNRHKVALALGYGRFTLSRRGGPPKLGQFSVSATDTWQVAGPVLVVYGLEFARFTEGASGTSVLPRLGIATDVSKRTRLFAGLVPGSSEDEQARVNLESGEIVFTEPRSVAISAQGNPVMDSSYRLQFGGEQMLSEDSSIEMMAFFDTVSGHGVGLLAIPAEGAVPHPMVRTEQMKGRSRGMRVVYHRRVNNILEGSIGYAFGEGQRLDERGLSSPADLFANEFFHVFTARIAANFINSGTRIATVLRLAPEQAIFAIDPFQNQISTYDPNISVSLTQEIPDFGMPGHWQAVVDVRNLLDQQASVADERQELIASRFHRLVRVGVALRF